MTGSNLIDNALVYIISAIVMILFGLYIIYKQNHETAKP